MQDKFYGLVSLIIGLFFLIPAARDMHRGYSVVSVRRGISEFGPYKPFGKTRISKPPELRYYFWVGGGLSIGVVFTTLGLALILIPSTWAEERKKRKQLQKGLTDAVSGELVCPYCGGVLRTNKAKQCPHCFRSWHNEKDT